MEKCRSRLVAQAVHDVRNLWMRHLRATALRANYRAFSQAVTGRVRSFASSITASSSKIQARDLTLEPSFVAKLAQGRENLHTSQKKKKRSTLPPFVPRIVRPCQRRSAARRQFFCSMFQDSKRHARWPVWQAAACCRTSRAPASISHVSCLLHSPISCAVRRAWQDGSSRFHPVSVPQDSFVDVTLRSDGR